MKTAKEILLALTLEEKAKLFVGKNYWEIEEIDGKNVFMSDGPHGLRKEVFDAKNKKSIVKAVCYPAACLSACSFDVNLLNNLGKELASECIHHNVDILLGPGINIKRNPLCGRNFEYFSEDPLLSGKLSSAYINGVQSKNVGVSLKHYALNSQELGRFVNDSICDERAMREIYLKAFEIAIKESSPWTIMASYNVVNGVHATENRHLLTEIGRNEFGFKGVYISDWGALYHQVDSLKAGLDLEMPGTSKGSTYRILEAIKNKELDVKVLDEQVLRLIELSLKTRQEKKDDFSIERSLELAKRINDESIVLLKNKDNILPLKESSTLALIGSFAKTPRYQGGGSSNINPLYVDNLYDEFKKANLNFEYAEGYGVDSIKANKKKIKEACKIAKDKDVVVIMCGLPKVIESEGYDRLDLKMPESHLKLIEEVSKVNSNVVVVLQNGSPIEMPFIDDVKAILEAYLGGSKHASSICDILLGKVNPSGRLSESFPIKYEDVVSSKYYLEDGLYSHYKESIYVGYRYYTSVNKKLLFPFGYGLSYSNVSYHEFILDKEDDEKLYFKCKVTNNSDLSCKEVIQIYVSHLDNKVFKAKKELKAFTKINLLPKETKEVELIISKEDLRYYSLSQNKWLLEQGVYRFYLAKHCEDDSSYIDVFVNSNDVCNEERIESYYNIENEITIEDFEKLIDRKIEANKKIKPFTVESPIAHYYRSVLGFIVFKTAAFFMVLFTRDKLQKKMLKKVIPYQPLRSLQTTTKLTKENLEGIVDIMNFHPIRGLRKLCSRKEK